MWLISEQLKHHQRRVCVYWRQSMILYLFFALQVLVQARRAARAYLEIFAFFCGVM